MTTFRKTDILIIGKGHRTFRGDNWITPLSRVGDAKYTMTARQQVLCCQLSENVHPDRPNGSYKRREPYHANGMKTLFEVFGYSPASGASQPVKMRVFIVSASQLVKCEIFIVSASQLVKCEIKVTAKYPSAL